MTQEKSPSTGKKAPDPRKMTREDRLKAALKANMARRKSQAKARANPTEDGQQDIE